MVESKWAQPLLFPLHSPFIVPWQLRINTFFVFMTLMFLQSFPFQKSPHSTPLMSATPALSKCWQSRIYKFPCFYPFCPSSVCPARSFPGPLNPFYSTCFRINCSSLILKPPRALQSLTLLNALSFKSQAPKSLSEHLRKLLPYISCSKTIGTIASNLSIH